MPLINGSSDDAIGANVKELRGAGYKLKQSLAIALRKAGKARPRKNILRKRKGDGDGENIGR